MPPAEGIQRVGQDLPPPTSTPLEESVRRFFAKPPTGRTYKPEYDTEEPVTREVHGKPVTFSPVIVPEGMDPFEEQAKRRAYYEDAATPTDLEKPDPKAVAAYQQLYGTEHINPLVPDEQARKELGPNYADPFVRLREMTGPAERVATQTKRLDDPELRAEFADFMAVKFPKGATRQQTVKAAAAFLRGDPTGLTSQHVDVSPKMLEQFLNTDTTGKKKPKGQRYAPREVRRADEVWL